MNLFYSDYNEKTGISKVTILTKDCGKFSGSATLSPEDQQYSSRFVGCQIAELRAMQKYFKEKIKRLNIQLQTLYKIQKEIKKIKKEYKSKKILNKKILVLQKQIDILKKENKDMNIAIDNIAKRHLKEAKRFNKKIEEKRKQDI